MKKTQGGKRKGAGRDPLADRGLIKIPVRFFIEEKFVKDCGGIDEAKEISIRAVISKARKNVRF